jgi:cytochrome c1
MDAAPASPDTSASAPDAAPPRPDASAAACTVLFGVPNARTGLTDTQCGPSCACEGLDFTPPTYDAAFIESLRASTLATPFEDLPTDPYAAGADALAPAAPEAVCGVHADASAPGAYRLATYADLPALTEDGATLTHFGARSTLAGGLLENNPEQLHRWIHNPESVKPGNKMAKGYIDNNIKLTAEDEVALVAYLLSLK